MRLPDNSRPDPRLLRPLEASRRASIPRRRAKAAYTRARGPARQPLADRDFVMLNLERTF